MPKRPSLTEIALAHDVMVLVANGDTPIEVDEDTKLIMGMHADSLGWVLGEESNLGELIEDVYRGLKEAGIEVTPRPDLVN